MTNNKKSSVGWLDNELASLYFDYLTGLIDNKEFNERQKEILEQAKEIHRTEIIESYASGSNDRLKNTINTNYYNETFE